MGTLGVPLLLSLPQNNYVLRDSLCVWVGMYFLLFKKNKQKTPPEQRVACILYLQFLIFSFSLFRILEMCTVPVHSAAPYSFQWLHNVTLYGSTLHFVSIPLLRTIEIIPVFTTTNKTAVNILCYGFVYRYKYICKSDL